jgi:hypothetical protein
MKHHILVCTGVYWYVTVLVRLPVSTLLGFHCPAGFTHATLGAALQVESAGFADRSEHCMGVMNWCMQNPQMFLKTNSDTLVLNVP